MKTGFIVCEIDENFSIIRILSDCQTYEEAQTYIEVMNVKGMFVINKVFFKY